jgi:hypothetical protein
MGASAECSKNSAAISSVCRLSELGVLRSHLVSQAAAICCRRNKANSQCNIRTHASGSINLHYWANC